MTAPKIYVVVGHRYRAHDLLGWFFDEHEALDARDALNLREGDDWATRVEACEPGQVAPSRCRNCGVCDE